MAVPIVHIDAFIDGSPGNSPYTRIQTTINASPTPIIAPHGLFIPGATPGASGDLYHAHNVASAEPTSAYKALTSTPATTARVFTATKNEGDGSPLHILMASFVTDSGVPNVSETLSGTWNFITLCQRVNDQANNDSAQIYYKVYKRSNANVNTLLFTTGVTGVVLSKLFRTTNKVASGTIVTTDRLYFELWAKFIQGFE